MPVWEAQYVIVIASKTGWPERFIRWELPLSRGYAYYHAARVLEGERCRWPGKTGAIGAWVDKMCEWARKHFVKSTKNR
jgi:hypothetical protein